MSTWLHSGGGNNRMVCLRSTGKEKYKYCMPLVAQNHPTADACDCSGRDRPDPVLAPREIRMGNFATVVAIVLMAQAIVVSAATPAAALTAELANKCRAMAIKAHPPPFPLGNKAYAQAQRDYFRECVSKNGEMPSGSPAKPSADQK
jgi:hypothetical protein